MQFFNKSRNVEKQEQISGFFCVILQLFKYRLAHGSHSYGLCSLKKGIKPCLHSVYLPQPAHAEILAKTFQFL